MSTMEMPDPDVLLAHSFALRVRAWANDQAQARGEALTKDAARQIYRAARHVSRATSGGHVCVLLADIVQAEQDARQAAGQGDAPAHLQGAIGAHGQPDAPDELVSEQDQDLYQDLDLDLDLDRYLEQYAGQPDDDWPPFGEHDAAHDQDQGHDRHRPPRLPAAQQQDRQSARQAKPPQSRQQDLFSEPPQTAQQDLFSEPPKSAQQDLFSEQPQPTQGDFIHHAGQPSHVPDIAAWRSLLLASGVVGTPEQPGACPLILDAADRLYLHKYFGFEKSLARRVRQADWSPGLPSAPTRELLSRLFARDATDTDQDNGQPDWQKVAAALALLRPITIISGGPGTGKTTTVANILACLVADNPGCRVALAAPTGRAAARMLAALNARAASIPAELVARFPQQSFTVHRLLGVTPSSGVFRHDAQRPVPYDVVVVDEASMLDLALAARLFDAVPQRARIILLGDMDQLAAVEAGSVFSDLSANPALSEPVRQDLAQLTGMAPALLQPSAPARGQGVTDAVVWLTRNYRFGKDSAIGQLAALVVAGAAADTLAWLQQQQFPHIDWIADEGDELPPGAMALAVESFLPYARAVAASEQDPLAVLAAFDQFRVLCAIRNTGRGVAGINAALTARMKANLPVAPQLPVQLQAAWYVGRPITILRNDHTLRLSNGDIGIALRDASGELMVMFPDREQGWRAIGIARLPEHETAWAMTVHRAQGSEFANVMTVLPGRASRVVTRELLYTAVTRTKQGLVLVGTAAAITSAVGTKTIRASGLSDRLREGQDPAHQEG